MVLTPLSGLPVNVAAEGDRFCKYVKQYSESNYSNETQQSHTTRHDFLARFKTRASAFLKIATVEVFLCVNVLFFGPLPGKDN